MVCGSDQEKNPDHWWHVLSFSQVTGLPVASLMKIQRILWNFPKRWKYLRELWFSGKPVFLMGPGFVHLPKPVQFLTLTDNLKGTGEIEQLQSLCPGYV